MARPVKAGLEYAGWMVNLFDGVQGIDRLLDRMGCTGFTVYFYLCQRAYGVYGYYYPYEAADAATIARKIGAGVTGEAVQKTVACCVEVGLFDEEKYRRYGVLTNREIQINFSAVKGKKTDALTRSEFWLFESFEGENAGFEGENGGFDDKKRREEKSKGDDSRVEQSVPTRRALVLQYGEAAVRRYINKAKKYHEDADKQLYAAAQWLAQDRAPPSEEEQKYEQRLLEHIPVYKKKERKS